MKQLSTIIFSSILLISCNGQHKENQKTTLTKDTSTLDSTHKSTSITKKEDLPEISKAKTWLTTAIENSLNKANGNMENSNTEAEGNANTIYTKQYYDYKDDAINVDLDDGLTNEEFFLKWKDKYNPELAGVGTGFLIPEQDYGHISVSQCELKKKIANGFIFNLVIADPQYKKKYKMDIKVIRNANSFLIDDVMEH
ncbi:hypothetical protein HDF26_005022 [Pedobacter cryoconitis]|uniref:hypothetical protein n=1 Tax=Pedobacter cryoconitis TaxID=188932 RepID=UPI00160D8E41|nr:hypothetical protein [Pedobacter cryoconitis]MBB6274544.1 hypothetical protein [Pedobacter cryoconitis]